MSRSNSPLPSGLVLLHAGWAKDDERWNFGPICSNFMRLYWVTRGSATVNIADREYTLKEGHFYLIPPLTTHYDHSSGVFEHYYLHVADPSSVWRNIFERYDIPFEVQADPTLTTFFSQMADSYPELRLPHPEPSSYETTPTTYAALRRFSAYDIATQCHITGTILLILSCFMQHAQKRATITDNRITRTLWNIEQNLSQQVNVTRLAREAALSKEQFIRLFHKQVGITPAAYIIKRKILHAQMLLAQQKTSVKQAAKSLGYDNISYFCRIFRQNVGMTPKEFHKQNA